MDPRALAAEFKMDPADAVLVAQEIARLQSHGPAIVEMGRVNLIKTVARRLGVSMTINTTRLLASKGRDGAAHPCLYSGVKNDRPLPLQIT